MPRPPLDISPWNEGLTLHENAEALHIKDGYAYAVASKHSLKFVRARMGDKYRTQSPPVFDTIRLGCSLESNMTWEGAE